MTATPSPTPTLTTYDGRSVPTPLPGAPPPWQAAFRVTKAQLNWSAGLRAALLTVVPLLLLPSTGWTALSWTSFTGFVVTLADKGGAYRTRARAMTLATLLGTLAMVLGSAASTSRWAAIAVVVVGAALCGFARTFGAEAAAAGGGIATVLVLASARPITGGDEILERALFTFAGGVWAMAFALLLWPVRFFRPYRLAVAASLRELAAYADALGREPALDSIDWHVRRGALVGRMRSSIETARGGLGVFRRGRPGPSARGELLLVLVEGADVIFGTLTAVGEALSFDRATAPDAAPRRVLIGLAAELEQVAEALVAETPLPDVPPLATLRSIVAANTLAPTQTRLLGRLLDEVDTLVQTARGVDDPTAPGAGGSRPEVRLPAASDSLFADLRALVNWRSDPVRHGLLSAVGTGVALWAGQALHLEHAAWAALTAYLILQPSGAATIQRALQRVAGTVVGALVAALLIAWLHDPLPILLFLGVSILLGVALLPLNYGLFAVFITPGFVLLASMHAPAQGLVAERLVSTAVGCLIALAFSFLFRTASERVRLADALGRAFGMQRALVTVAFDASRTPTAMNEARRRLGLALVNAESAFQQLLVDASPSPVESETQHTLLVYAHRLGASLIALALTPEETTAEDPSAALVASLSAALADLEGAMHERRAPAPFDGATLRTQLASAPHRARLERLVNQFEIAHGAATRWIAMFPE